MARREDFQSSNQSSILCRVTIISSFRVLFMDMKEIVVARYNENPDKWLSINDKNVKVTIYNKGDADDRFINIPNVGREAETWLRHIVENYDNLSDVTFFAQGDCSPHYPNLIQSVTNATSVYSSFTELSNHIYFLEWETHEFDTAATRREMQARGIEPAKIIQNNKSMWEELFSSPFRLPSRAPCGAQFSATRESIRRLPLKFWKHLYDVVMKRPMGAWEMEPLWNRIFTEPLFNFRKELVEEMKDNKREVQQVGPNEYSEFQKKFYTAETPIMKIQNHNMHNSNPDYWNILLAPLKENPENWNGKSALDFGCGCGRNLVNMATFPIKWDRVDGCDISEPNCRESESLVGSVAWDTNCKCYPTNGYELDGVPSDTYDFVMSTIVLQHICVHDVRFNILKEIFRVMKSGSMFSFQMGMGKTIGGHTSNFAEYYDNVYEARKTNSGYDVDVSNADYLTDELKQIGFEVKEVKITKSYEDACHPEWVWVKAVKP